MGGKSADPNKAAMRQQKEQMKRLDKINTPELQEYILQNPELVGMLDAETIDPSAMEDIKEDAGLKSNQLAALEALKERSEQGLTEQDKAQAEQLVGQVAAQEKSQRAAIEQDMQRKGMADSGSALMQKMLASQGAANSGRQQALQQAAQGANQRMQALQALGSQSGQMQQQQFGRQSQVASAKDAIARANAMNRQNVNQGNLAARQNIENQRAATANQQSQVKNQIAQQDFDNRMAKASGQGNVANSMSSIAGQAKQGPSGFQKLATVGGAVAGGMMGGPAGISAGASAGSALGGMFEDGGIVGQAEREAEGKQRAAFKKKYIKQMHDEILGIKSRHDTPVHAEDGAVISKEDAEKKAMMEKISAAGDVAGLLSKDESSPQSYNLESASYNAPSRQKMAQGPNFLNPMADRQMAALEDGGTVYAEDGSLSFTSDGEGDIIGGDSFADDRVDAKVNSGEAVLNIPQQQRFMDLVRGKISPEELGDEDIVEGVNESYRDELHEKIEGGSDSQAKGFKKLLKMLGE